MKKQTKVLLLVLLTLGLLTACKKESSLEVYDLGESEADKVVALDSLLYEGEAILFSIDAPTDAAIAESLDISHTYHYRQMDDPAALAERYIQVLMGEEQGFVTIDGENHRLEEEPVTDILAGSVSLAKAAEATTEDGGSRILRVIVGWSEYEGDWSSDVCSSDLRRSLRMRNPSLPLCRSSWISSTASIPANWAWRGTT